LEYTWVIGLSAVGKLTFIIKAINGELAADQRERLGLSNGPEIVARGSGFWDVPDREFCCRPPSLPGMLQQLEVAQLGQAALEGGGPGLERGVVGEEALLGVVVAAEVEQQADLAVFEQQLGPADGLGAVDEPHACHWITSPRFSVNITARCVAPKTSMIQ